MPQFEVAVLLCRQRKEAPAEAIFIAHGLIRNPVDEGAMLNYPLESRLVHRPSNSIRLFGRPELRCHQDPTFSDIVPSAIESEPMLEPATLTGWPTRSRPYCGG